MKLTSLHINDALRLLSDGSYHKVQVWRLTGPLRGELLTYDQAALLGGFKRTGKLRFRLPMSGVIRATSEFALFSVDDLIVYM